MQATICVVGIDEPLGQVIGHRLQQSGFRVQGIDAEHLALTTEALVRQLKELPQANYIVNAAEMRDLQTAERHPDLAYQMNVACCEAIAEVALKWNAAVIQLSSFQVFDGQKKNPYISANKGRPVNAYGRTKLQAEELLQERLERLVVLRLGWVLDTRADGWMVNNLKAWDQAQSVEAFPDVLLSPTAAEDVARVIDAVIKQLECEIHVWGIYHYAGAEPVSHEDMTRALHYQAYGQDQDAADQRITAHQQESGLAEYRLPPNGVLGCIKLRNTFGIKQLPWRRFLPAMVEELAEQGVFRHDTGAGSEKSGVTLTR